MSEPYDPYAVPRGGPASPAGPPQPWDAGEVLSLAWARFQEHWLVLVLAYSLPLLITHGATWVLYTATHVPMFPPPMGSIGAVFFGQFAVRQTPGWLLQVVAGAFFASGMLRISLDAARGREPQLGMLFTGGDRFVAMLGVNVLVWLATMGGICLLIVPGVIIALGLFVAQFYVVDANMDPIEAIRASWSATSGHKGDLFVLALAFGGIGLLGLLACCIGIFAAAPICYVATAIVYTRLSGRGTAVAEIGPMG